MPPNDPFYHFAYTTVCVCLPTYVLIFVPGALPWCTAMAKTLYPVMGRCTASLLDKLNFLPEWTQAYQADTSPPLEPIQPKRPKKVRSGSTEVAMALRTATGAAAPVLSPTVSRTLSGDASKPRRPVMTSPPPTSIRFDPEDMMHEKSQQSDNVIDEDAGPTAHVGPGDRSAEKNVTQVRQTGGMRDRGRSWSFFSKRQRKRDCQEAQSDPC